ncbi:MAG: hypothetical protein U5L45_14615 [Saprospiraceae bacterium]|nr:hypothetical protein [Saprospiraceae bacterium]
MKPYIKFKRCFWRARSEREASARRRNVVHFSDFARKMNHLSFLCASEASV